MRSGQVQYDDDLKDLMVPIDSIKQHGDNPNNGDVEEVMASIRRNGMYRPVYVARDGNEIYAGNTTWEACKALDAEVIPALFSDGDYATNIRRMLADNKVASLARLDPGQELILVEEVYLTEGGLEGTGYTDYDLDRLRIVSEEPLELEPETESHPLLCFQVPPATKAKFLEMTDAAHGDRERFELLLRLASDTVSE